MPREFPFPAIAGIEPPISDILADETLHLLLARDGLGVIDVYAVITEWREKRATHSHEIGAAA